MIAPGLRLAAAREAVRHPWQVGLTLLGISLGVAVVVAVELASASAHRGFLAANRIVMGRTTHLVTAGGQGVPLAVLAAVRRAVPAVRAAPVVETPVRVPGAGSGADTYTLLGLDPLSEPGFRGFRLEASGPAASAARALLARERAVALSPRTAHRLGVGPGDTLAIEARGATHRLAVAGRLGGPAEPSRLETASLDRLLVVDVATGLALAGRGARLTRIDLIVPPGALAAVAAALPPGVRLEDAGARAAAGREMTRAFEVNLRMLSLLSLAVGMLLVYNAMAFAVTRRRTLIGTLRALGVQRAEVLALLLGEACAMGAAGALLGLGLGVVLATRLVDLVTRTMTDLYFVTEVRDVALTGAGVAAALGLGFATAVLATAAPALEAARLAPRIAILRSSAGAVVRLRAGRLAAIGAGLVAASLGLGILGGLPPPGGAERPPAAGGLGIGYAALLAMLAGAVLAVPLLTRALTRGAEGALGPAAPMLARLALRGVAGNLGRTSLAIMAFMVALAATVGVGVMVDSFRRAVDAWLAGTLRADLYVARRDAAAAPLDPGWIATLAAEPGVSHLSRGRWVTVMSPHGETRLLALAAAPESYAGFELLSGGPRVWERFERGAGVLVSEPFAFHRRLARGERLALLTDRGRVSLPVLGVFRDYRSERGFVLISRPAYERHWADREYTAVGIYLEPGADAEAVRARVAATLPAGVEIRSNVELRRASLAIFDRTFAVTEVLRILTVLVAFVAVLSALMALELDRRRERALLRATGLTRGQTLVLAELEGLVIGLVAGLLALPVGVGLAWLLVAVINRRSFGWSMDLHVDPLILAQALALGVAAAALAALYPAYRVARAAPARSLREE